jgi:CheY-like chemotaxis protein
MSGFCPTCVATGDAALAVLDDSHIVLLDIGLPGMDGFAVARKLREAGKSIFVIALTGYGGNDFEQQSKDAGIDLHLLKPVDPEYLTHVLNRLCASGEVVR